MGFRNCGPCLPLFRPARIIIAILSIRHCINSKLHAKSACSTSRTFHFNLLVIASNQSLSRPATLITGIGRATDMITLPPRSRFPMCRPSSKTEASPMRAWAGSWTSTVLISLMRTGLKESEAGAMGVSSVAGTLGDRMGPPLLKLYPVDPVGEEMMRPSPSTSVTKEPSTRRRSLPMAVPRLKTTTSFSACHVLHCSLPLLSRCSWQRKRVRRVHGSGSR
mmetsp:Transcript_34992/g.61464  ORF Transcript_34992/g.61464 Transcript_34992/m.61464 type:complete len:221 (-) Transcript_34992:258-920(-)